MIYCKHWLKEALYRSNVEYCAWTKCGKELTPPYYTTQRTIAKGEFFCNYTHCNNEAGRRRQEVKRAEIEPNPNRKNHRDKVMVLPGTVCGWTGCGKALIEAHVSRRKYVDGQLFCDYKHAKKQDVQLGHRERTKSGIDKDKRKAWELRTNYNMTLEQWQSMWDKQDGKCAICKLVFDQSIKQRQAHVDHDHNHCPQTPACGNCNRALLCQKCNHAIGLLHDDSEIVLRTAWYLIEYACNQSQEVMPHGH